MKNDIDPLGMMVLEYMLQQKLLGREKLYESEICETLGFPWDDKREDRLYVLTDLGENAVSLHDHKKNKRSL